MSEASIQKLAEWKAHPALFAEEALGMRLDKWQVAVHEAFPYNNRMAMKACKGPGKTACLASLSWNFMVTRPQAQIAATSISADNIADGLWKEMAIWQGRSPLLTNQFTWTKTRITENSHSETWFMSLRSWSKSASKEQQADALAGFHNDYLMFVLDEAGGIPDGVMAAAEAGLSTGIETKLLIAGNPTHLEGPLYRACNQERQLWWVIEITGDPDDPMRSPRVSIEWARQQIEKYGRDNPWVLVNVFGKFPPQSINSLMGVEEVRAAMNRQPRPEEYNWAQKRLGVDVARFGDDRTVLFPRQGLRAFMPVVMRNARTDMIAARVMMAHAKWKPEIIFVDDTGHWGHGVIDNCYAGGIEPIGLQYHGPAIDPRFRNRRCEMWMGLADWVKRGGCLPDIPELVAELATPTYTFTNGTFLLEDKDQIKARLGRSPDLGDALAQTFALPDMPGARMAALPGGLELPMLPGDTMETATTIDRSYSQKTSTWDYEPGDRE